MNNFIHLIRIVISVLISRLAMDLWLHLVYARKKRNIRPEFQDNAFQYQYKLYTFLQSWNYAQSKFLKR